MKFALIGYGKMGKVIEDVILSANTNKTEKMKLFYALALKTNMN
jgi:pyrroline-5-carboxylate reductase